MANFTTRVELHGASQIDYGTLHRAMEQNGFSRTITGDNGITYQLPEAEYDCTAQNAEQVRQAAANAAATTGRAFSILVTQAVARAWSGLVQVNPLARYAPPVLPTPFPYFNK